MPADPGASGAFGAFGASRVELPSDVRRHFRRFLDSDPGRLHVAAHSHHPWPDVTLEAHTAAWHDAARLHDDKWEHVFGTVLPEARGHVARRLRLPDAGSIAFAPNTHDLVRRVLSCLPRPTRVLTTDGEFHSFARQAARLAEAGDMQLTRVPVEPFATFTERFAAAAAAGGHDLVYLSQVMFDSGHVVDDLPGIVAAVPDPRTYVVVDGYHGFMALPTDFSSCAARAFYVAGGYKYAMAGEGACFLHAPPGYGTRPVDTGWYAGFDALEDGHGARVAYRDGGDRFLGATFDPSGLYRFNAVQRLLDAEGITVEAIHAHVGRLQEGFLARVDGLGLDWLSTAGLLPPAGMARGHFLTFRTARAAAAHAALRAADVVADRRGDRLRFGFGLYHDVGDVDELCTRLAALAGRSEESEEPET